MNQYFCFHPWQGLDISAQNMYKPCCKYTKTFGNSIDEYYKNPELQNLRNNFLQGKQDPGCVRCWQDEAAGLQSKRQLDSKYVFDSNAAFTDRTDLKSLNIALGNICNLTCRTCDSFSSSKWRSDEIKLKTIYPQSVNKIFLHSDFYKDQKFYDDLFKYADNISAIDIIGGEPFFIDTEYHYYFLSNLKNQNKISLKYITNCSVVPDEKIVSLWKNFAEIELLLSLDGVGVHNNYIRHPSQWETIYKNLKYFQSLKNISLSVSHTLSILNIFYLPEFIIWCIKEKLPRPYINLVFYPAHYNIKNLPKNIKSLIIKRFEKFQKINELKTVLNYLQQHVDDPEEWQKFINITKELDLIRNQSIEYFLPELHQIMALNN